MKNRCFLLILTSLISWLPQAAKSDEQLRSQLIGSWQFTGFIYQGKFNPPLNPQLVLLFDFLADGTDRLFWTRKEETGFCERHGKFFLENNLLNDTITWVNPKNAFNCGQDPDMILGRSTRNEISIEGNRLSLFLSLSDEPFIYVWERVPPQP